MPFWCKIDLVSFELKFCLLLRIKLRIARHLAIGNCILSSPGKISPDLTAIFRFLTAIFLKHLKFDVVKFPAKFEFFKFDISRAREVSRAKRTAYFEFEISRPILNLKYLSRQISNLKSPAKLWIWILSWQSFEHAVGNCILWALYGADIFELAVLSML